VTKEIFFPADLEPSHESMSGYADLFSHLNPKTFSAFFMCDFVEQDITQFNSPMDRTLVVRKLEAEARLLKLNIDFFNPGSYTVKALIHRSRFADLVLINPLPLDVIDQLPESFITNFIEPLACPVLLSSKVPLSYDEVLIVFDADASSLTALKTFLHLFGGVANDKTVTVLMVNRSDKPELFLEHYFIRFVKNSFSNVGIVPMNGIRTNEELVKLASHAKNPLLIMGKSAIAFLRSNETAKTLFSQEASIFYSNG
jgi:hypothetical protein